MAIDPEALAASLRRLATLGEPGSGVVEALRHVTEACVGLFGVTGSGIMLADEQNVPRYVAASDGPGRMLEVVESDTGQGPCTEAFVNNTVVASADVTAEERWPDLASALRPHRIRAVLGLPVRAWVVSPSALSTCATTIRMCGRTTSARPWLATAMWSNPPLPLPWRPTTQASWPCSCSMRWIIE